MSRDNRTIRVEAGDGATMTLPLGKWRWELRYGKDTSEPPTCDDRMLAASVFDSYMYLVCGCTQKEAWHRIKLMRAALKDTKP